MALTPLDIKGKDFKRSIRGFDPEDVHDFLEDVADELEKANRDKASLEKEISDLKNRLSEYNELEATIRKTLTMAQKASEDALTNARKEAELIIEDARHKGREIENDFSKIKAAKRSFVIELGALTDAFRRSIAEFGEKDNINGSPD